MVLDYCLEIYFSFLLNNWGGREPNFKNLQVQQQLVVPVSAAVEC